MRLAAAPVHSCPVRTRAIVLHHGSALARAIEAVSKSLPSKQDLHRRLARRSQVLRIVARNHHGHQDAAAVDRGFGRWRGPMIKVPVLSWHCPKSADLEASARPPGTGGSDLDWLRSRCWFVDQRGDAVHVQAQRDAEQASSSITALGLIISVPASAPGCASRVMWCNSLTKMAASAGNHAPYAPRPRSWQRKTSSMDGSMRSQPLHFDALRRRAWRIRALVASTSSTVTLQPAAEHGHVQHPRHAFGARAWSRAAPRNPDSAGCAR